ncbi:RICIN domain-containing protein [Kitasatospora sp. NPDC094028]
MVLDGVYDIRSAVNGENAGVNGLLRIAFQPVEVTSRSSGSDIGTAWEVAPVGGGDGRVRLSVYGVYRNVHDEGGQVIASVAGPEAVWTVQPASGDRVRIRLDGQDLCWTAPEDGKGPVSLEPESHAIGQLWTFHLVEQPAP